MHSLFYFIDHLRMNLRRAALVFTYLGCFAGCSHVLPVRIEGVVLRQDPDTREQLPISGVAISGQGQAVTSDESGYFALSLPAGFRPRTEFTLAFRRAGYNPVDLAIELDRESMDEIHVIRMAPVVKAPPLPRAKGGTGTTVSDVRVRYSTKTPTAVDVGSAAKTFQVVNTGGKPCDGRAPCSPDGRWKAATGAASLDAGDGNEFRNARVSCIAGPCPFTKVAIDNFSRGGRMISVTMLDWSDTATFLLQAEVFHPMSSDQVRMSFPVKFGQTFSFTLPSGAEGASLLAELNGATIVFPLGPRVALSWASCDERNEKDGSKGFRCDLKDGYSFR